MDESRLRAVLRVLKPIIAAEASSLLQVRDGEGDRGEIITATSRKRARGVRAALEQLGPFYVKVGQMLSTRPDFVPPAMVEEFRLLHDQVAARPFSEFVPVVEAELPYGMRYFRDIDTEHPLGSASLAQVYAVTLHNGDSAVVKIQRPGIQRMVKQDMAILRKVAKRVGRWMPRLNTVVDLDATLGAVFDAMHDELDFTTEARNMEIGRRLVRPFTSISVPEVLEVTPRVLVQSLAPGCSIRDINPQILDDDCRKDIGSDLLGLMMRSFFVDRVFHADPHPGNIFVDRDGRANLIDWGMVGKIDRHISNSMLMSMLNLGRNDAPGLARSWITMGAPTPWADIPSFISDMTILVPKVAAASLGDMNYGLTLGSILTSSTRRGIKTAPMVALLGKSFSNAEGSVRYLAPELAISDVFEYHLRRIVMDLVREMTGEEDLAHNIFELAFASNEVPAHLRSIIRDVANREITVQVSSLLGYRVGTDNPRTHLKPFSIALVVLGAIKLWIDRRNNRAASKSN